MSAKRKHKSPSAFLRYLKGELSNTERHALERDLEADAFEKEAMEGFALLSPDELEEDILSLHSRMRKRQQRRRRVALYSIAATVASILVVGTIFINIYDFNPEADKELDRTEESLLLERSPEESESGIEVSEEIDPDEVIDPDEEIREEENGLTEKSQTEESRVSGVAGAKRAGAAKKLEEPLDKPEPPEAELEFEMEALEEAEDVMMDELVSDMAETDDAKAAVPEMIKEEVPAVARDMAEEGAEAIAPMPEPDAVLTVEAAPTRRQKKAQSKARTAPSMVDQVSGVVISAEDMDPLPGASVVLKGTNSGYVTDMEGRFSVPAGGKAQTTVVASYVGMLTEEYQLDPEQENRVVMQPDLASLDEVVVVAYGAQTEKYPVSAVQKVQVNQEGYYSEFTGAEPDGGIAAFKMYIEKNIRFPAGDTLSKREVVVLSFTVEADGKLSGIQTLRSPGQAFTKEAFRLLEEGPAWNPARNENASTDDMIRMRIVFKK